MPNTPEGYLLDSILQFLAAKHILAFRMQVGAVKVDGKRFLRFGTPGMADILAFPVCNEKDTYYFGHELPLWIECKSPKGKQSPLQKSFQALVESHGHRYIVARSIEDLKAALR